ncbi:hypothetical protein PCASD_00661 [Puccinia coronata f. sp. avenae]|uniref:Uncharacterized protein n=1 Tax=Puccinia coronata f. sp. avenae TaxID=200324 RepID=A0A2N5VL71_9BASI|nr:hypothetical protein PCASD_00661 [Puccinia coronata f. sp. avenae]
MELLPGATPQAGQVIPLSPAKQEALRTLIEDGLAAGTIRRTKSPWAAPVLFTGKKDGNLRPCFDYQKLNAVMVKNKYLLPLNMDLVNSLRNADTFTKLDLRNAYGNLRVAEGDKDKLSFICQAGQFALLTMPFGPTGAPGYFQYFIQDIFVGRIGGVDHQQAVTSLLEILSKHQLWLKPEKYQDGTAGINRLNTAVQAVLEQPCLTGGRTGTVRPKHLPAGRTGLSNQFLGPVAQDQPGPVGQICPTSWLLLWSDSVRPTTGRTRLFEHCSSSRVRPVNAGSVDPTKVTAVTEWPAPRSVTKLQRFIGFANFYCWFISHFSGLARPSHDLTGSKTPFHWTPRCEQAFQELKQAFTTAPILKIADPYQAFVLECDCSDFALGAVLSQVCKRDHQLHPVVFLSWSLVQSKKNYEIFDKELLAIVAAFKEWQHYLEGNPHRLEAIVYTDHWNLESFMTTKELTSRQARWAETMGCFDFEIVFRPGCKSSKPDSLSQRPNLAPAKEEWMTFSQLLKPCNITPETFAEVSEFKGCFLDESVEFAKAEFWFQVDVMGTKTEDQEAELSTEEAILHRIR